MSFYVYSCRLPGRVTPSVAVVELTENEDVFHGCELVKAALPPGTLGVEILSGGFSSVHNLARGTVHRAPRKQPASDSSLAKRVRRAG